MPPRNASRHAMTSNGANLGFIRILWDAATLRPFSLIPWVIPAEPSWRRSGFHISSSPISNKMPEGKTSGV